jgi:hypothetical protein
MLRNINEAEARLENFGISGMRLSACFAHPSQLPADWFQKFLEMRKKFMKSLDDSIAELAIINLSQEDFMDLLRARRIPENLTVRFRRPLVFGGAIEAENMFLTPLFMTGINLDVFMTEQMGQSEIYYPDPAKKVFVTSAGPMAGAGGNATADRLAQGFAMMGQGRI